MHVTAQHRSGVARTDEKSPRVRSNAAQSSSSKPSRLAKDWKSATRGYGHRGDTLHLPNHRINPSGGKSGTRYLAAPWPAARAIHSAARCPLRTAPSIVAGQLVAVQSPARNTRGHGVALAARYRSTPGFGAYVAFTSLITVDFSNFASRVSGKNSLSSLTASAMISDRDFSSNDFDELTTSST